MKTMVCSTDSIEEAVDCLLGNGYAILSNLLPAETVELLQLECNLLSRSLCKTEPVSENDENISNSANKNEIPENCKEQIIKQGCIVQPISPQDAKYSKCNSAEDYKQFRSEWCMHGKKDISLKIHSALFEHIPILRLLSSVFGSKFFLYNEQYIVKPSCNGSENSAFTEFPWHRDSDPADCKSAYISIWIALDEMKSNNGALRALSYGDENSPEKAQVLLAKTGDIVLLAHDMWHCSSPNRSVAARRAYMMQFSQIPMQNSTGGDIALAVPFVFNS